MLADFEGQATDASLRSKEVLMSGDYTGSNMNNTETIYALGDLNVHYLHGHPQYLKLEAVKQKGRSWWSRSLIEVEKDKRAINRLVLSTLVSID